MRRRRKAKSPTDTLRRLALAGQWDEVRALLSERLTRNPHDAEARSELERLRQGLPLRVTESALTRKRREEQEMREELTAELALYRSTPAMVDEWPPALLDKRRRRVILIRATLGSRLSADMEQESAAYLAALTSRGARHRSKRRLQLILGIALPLLALSAGALALSLQQRAAQAHEALSLALQSRDFSRVELALRAANTGANKLASSGLGELIQRAQVWQARSTRLRSDILRELERLEAGEESIRTLPLLRRAELERTLRALPADMDSLRKRWQALCEKEARALAAQREEVLARFRAPLPPLPALCGTPSGDDAVLKEQQTELQQQVLEWRAARELYRVEENLAAPLEERLDTLRRLREDIAAHRRTIALLPTTRSYTQYRDLLGRHRPTLYPPALQVAAIRDRLPDEDSLRERMQEHGRELTPELLAAARHALLEGGTNFSPSCPANALQLQLMEDLFTARVLQQPLYEMSARTLPSVIVEERPDVSETSVSFIPSPLDPDYTLDTPRRITWHNPQGVFIRRIDATPLLRETGIRREDFFTRANLPALLDTLLRVEHGECPELARAFVFKRLLEVMRAHDCALLLGTAYAPTLRADARSFAALVQELGIPLEAGCWLQDLPDTARAEELCARWFRERRHRRYAAEIARNFSALVQIHPRYVGYMGADGHPCLHRKLPENTLLWYMTEDGLTTSPLGEAAEAPIPYSPVFIVAKD